jgi:hypothetical protein
MLVDAAVASEEPWQVCYPIFYLYRHALELYFKHALPQHGRGHNLTRLISEYDEFLRSQSRPALPTAVRENLLTLPWTRTGRASGTPTLAPARSPASTGFPWTILASPWKASSGHPAADGPSRGLVCPTCSTVVPDCALVATLH